MLLTAHSASAVTLSFSPPQVVSAPIECFDASQNRRCGYLQNSTCQCPELPAAADSFYALDSNASRMMGVYSERNKGIVEITYTANGGSSWKRKNFSGAAAAFDWSTYAVNGGAARRTFGGIGLGSYRNRSLGSMTDRSWTSKRSATYSFDSSGELQVEVTAPSGRCRTLLTPRTGSQTSPLRRSSMAGRSSCATARCSGRSACTGARVTRSLRPWTGPSTA
jgi:hypothetical protein